MKIMAGPQKLIDSAKFSRRRLAGAVTTRAEDNARPFVNDKTSWREKKPNQFFFSPQTVVFKKLFRETRKSRQSTRAL